MYPEYSVGNYAGGRIFFKARKFEISGMFQLFQLCAYCVVCGTASCGLESLQQAQHTPNVAFEVCSLGPV